MKSLTTQISDEIKNLFKMFDYLVWLLIDPSKFTIIKNNKIKKAIVINPGAIGELIITTPLISQLKKQIGCDISVMIRKGSEDILKNNPDVSEILFYDKNFWDNVNELKKRKFDLAVIIFPGSTKVALMCILGGIKWRIGCYKGVKDGIALGYSRRIFPINLRESIPQYYLDILRQIKIKERMEKTYVYLNKSEELHIKKLMKKLKIKNYAVIHPGFGHYSREGQDSPSKLWPVERYSEIINYLAEKYKLKILLTGIKDERNLAMDIKNNVKTKNRQKVIIASGNFSLREYIGIIKNSKIVIEPCTCTRFIAFSFYTPVITLGGKLTLYEWFPIGNSENIRLLFHNEVCTGCNKVYCRKKTTECMKAITEEEVKTAIDSLLKKGLTKRVS